MAKTNAVHDAESQEFGRKGENSCLYLVCSSSSHQKRNCPHAGDHNAESQEQVKRAPNTVRNFAYVVERQRACETRSGGWCRCIQSPTGVVSSPIKGERLAPVVSMVFELAAIQRDLFSAHIGVSESNSSNIAMCEYHSLKRECFC